MSGASLPRPSRASAQATDGIRRADESRSTPCFDLRAQGITFLFEGCHSGLLLRHLGVDVRPVHGAWGERVITVPLAGSARGYNELIDERIRIGFDQSSHGVARDTGRQWQLARTPAVYDRMKRRCDQATCAQQISEAIAREPSEVSAIEEPVGLVLPPATQQVQPDIDVANMGDRDHEESVVRENPQEVGDNVSRVANVLEHVAQEDDVKVAVNDRRGSDLIEVHFVNRLGELACDRGIVGIQLEADHRVS